MPIQIKEWPHFCCSAATLGAFYGGYGDSLFGRSGQVDAHVKDLRRFQVAAGDTKDAELYGSKPKALVAITACSQKVAEEALEKTGFQMVADLQSTHNDGTRIRLWVWQYGIQPPEKPAKTKERRKK